MSHSFYCGGVYYYWYMYDSQAVPRLRFGRQLTLKSLNSSYMVSREYPNQGGGQFSCLFSKCTFVVQNQYSYYIERRCHRSSSIRASMSPVNSDDFFDECIMFGVLKRGCSPSWDWLNKWLTSCLWHTPSSSPPKRDRHDLRACLLCIENTIYWWVVQSWPSQVDEDEE